ncbi:MAG: hypothetical protein R3D03_08250 [Geminicoccaceae bacterium]
MMAVLVSLQQLIVCPDWLLVEEAGGIATRYTADGTSLVDRRPVAACTPAIVAEVSSIHPPRAGTMNRDTSRIMPEPIPPTLGKAATLPNGAFEAGSLQSFGTGVYSRFLRYR